MWPTKPKIFTTAWTMWSNWLCDQITLEVKDLGFNREFIIYTRKCKKKL